MAWLGNGYTVSDYDGGSRTKYLDPNFIDYPPIPDDEEDVANGTYGTNGYYKVENLLPQAFAS
jgi:hypothetical protein